MSPRPGPGMTDVAPGWQAVQEHTAGTDPLPTVNWRHVENGKITAIRVTFDPRPLTTRAAAGCGPPHATQ